MSHLRPSPSRPYEILRITSDGTPDGYPFVVRIVREGDGYGLKHCLIYKNSAPMIEFYDACYDNDLFDPGLGQFITRYDQSTLTGNNSVPPPKSLQGIMLDTGSPYWRISEPVMKTVIDWISARTLCNTKI